MKLFILNTPTIIEMNKKICVEGGNPIHCFDPGKIDSALHSAFFPGEEPFVHGGIGSIAGALAFYICQAHAFQDGNKRTAALTAVVFLNANGFDIEYTMTDHRDEFSDLMLGIAAGQLNIDHSKSWFDTHKINI